MKGRGAQGAEANRFERVRLELDASALADTPFDRDPSGYTIAPDGFHSMQS
jgi:hypothetical protein